VSWTPTDNPFQGEKVYTASVTLTADTGYAFDPALTATVNGNTADTKNYAVNTITISYDFTETSARTLAEIVINQQPTKLTYSDGDALDLSGLEITLVYDDGTSKPVAHGNTGGAFEADGIETSPEHGGLLSFSTHNVHPVVVSCGGQSAGTLNLIVVEWPAGLTATYGQSLSDVSLDLFDNDDTGSFAWVTDTDPVGDAGECSHEMLFTPNDPPYNMPPYETLTHDVSLTVNKADPKVAWPDDLEIIYGQTLAALAIPNFTGGTDRFTGSNVPGTFAFANSTTGPTVANSGVTPYGVIFTPTDTDNYNLITGSITLTVNKRSLNITVGPPSANPIIPLSPSLIPFSSNGDPDYDNTVTIPLTIENPTSLAFTDTVTISPVSSSALSDLGLMLSNSTLHNTGDVTLTYDGNETVPDTSNDIAFAVTIDDGKSGNYNITINGGANNTVAFNVTIYDGQNELRFIPITQGDILGFRAYAGGKPSKYYRMTEHIDLAGETWGRIISFYGDFNGDGYTIKNLIHAYGLFDTINADGMVQNVGLIDIKITRGDGSIGGIAGSNDGTIQNCYVTADVGGNDVGVYNTMDATDVSIGGIVGTNNANGIVQNCYVTVDINVAGGASGGIAGRNTGMVQNCYVTGSVINNSENGGLKPGVSSNFSYTGGITGLSAPTVSSGTVQNCVALNPSLINKSVDRGIGRITGVNGYKSGNGLYFYPYMSMLNNNYARNGIEYFSDEYGNHEPINVPAASQGSPITQTLYEKDGTAMDITAFDESWWTDAGNWNTNGGAAWDFVNVWYWGTDDLPKLRIFIKP